MRFKIGKLVPDAMLPGVEEMRGEWFGPDKGQPLMVELSAMDRDLIATYPPGPVRYAVTHDEEFGDGLDVQAREVWTERAAWTEALRVERLAAVVIPRVPWRVRFAAMWAAFRGAA